MVLKLSGNPEQQLALRRFDKPAQLQKSLSGSAGIMRTVRAAKLTKRYRGMDSNHGPSDPPQCGIILADAQNHVP